MQKMISGSSLALILVLLGAAADASADVGRSSKTISGIDGVAFVSAEDAEGFRVGLLISNRSSSSSKFFASISPFEIECANDAIETRSDAAMSVPQEKFHASAIVEVPKGTASLWLQPYRIKDREALARCSFEFQVWGSGSRFAFQRRVSYEALRKDRVLQSNGVPRLLSAEVNKANGRRVAAILVPRIGSHWERRLTNCGDLKLEDNSSILGFDELALDDENAIVFGMVRAPGEFPKGCRIAISVTSGDGDHSFSMVARARYIDMTMNPDWGFRFPRVKDSK